MCCKVNSVSTSTVHGELTSNPCRGGTDAPPLEDTAVHDFLRWSWLWVLPCRAPYSWSSSTPVNCFAIAMVRSSCLSIAWLRAPTSTCTKYVYSLRRNCRCVFLPTKSFALYTAVGSIATGRRGTRRPPSRSHLKQGTLPNRVSGTRQPTLHLLQTLVTYFCTSE